MTTKKGEINSGEIKVDVAGYVPRRRRIESIIAAGKRLEELRRQGLYDVQPGQDPPDNLVPDPTREKGFDKPALADIMRKGSEAADRLIKSTAENKKVSQAKNNKDPDKDPDPGLKPGVAPDEPGATR